MSKRKITIDLEEKKPLEHLPTLTLVQELNERIRNNEIRIKFGAYPLEKRIGFVAKEKGEEEWVWTATDFSFDDNENKELAIGWGIISSEKDKEWVNGEAYDGNKIKIELKQ